MFSFLSPFLCLLYILSSSFLFSLFLCLLYILIFLSHFPLRDSPSPSPSSLPPVLSIPWHPFSLQVHKLKSCLMDAPLNGHMSQWMDERMNGKFKSVKLPAAIIVGRLSPLRAKHLLRFLLNLSPRVPWSGLSFFSACNCRVRRRRSAMFSRPVWGMKVPTEQDTHSVRYSLHLEEPLLG